MATMRDLSGRSIAISCAVLADIYVLRLLWASIIAAWKVGWESRPLVHVGLEGVLAYLMFAAGVGFMSLDAGRRRRDRTLTAAAIAAVGGLAVYWVGLLTGAIGIG